MVFPTAGCSTPGIMRLEKILPIFQEQKGVLEFGASSDDGECNQGRAMVTIAIECER